VRLGGDSRRLHLGFGLSRLFVLSDSLVIKTAKEILGLETEILTVGAQERTIVHAAGQLPVSCLLEVLKVTQAYSGCFGRLAQG